MDQEDAIVAGRFLRVLARTLSVEDLLENGGGGGEVATRLGDSHLQIGGLEVGRVFTQELVDRGLGPVEVAQIAKGAPAQVEGEAILGVGLQHGVGLGQRLLGPPGADQDLAQGQAHADVRGVELEGLPVVQDRLVRLGRLGVDVPEGLVGAGGVGLQLERRLEGRRRLVRLAQGQEMAAHLDVGVEVARVELEVPLPDPKRILVLAELAVDAGQREQGGDVGGVELHHLLVGGGRLSDLVLRFLPFGLQLVQLAEGEEGARALRVEPHCLVRVDEGLVDPAHVAEEARRLHPHVGRPWVEPLGVSILLEGDRAVSGEASLETEAEVVVGLVAATRLLAWVLRRALDRRFRGRCDQDQGGENKHGRGALSLMKSSHRDRGLVKARGNGVAPGRAQPRGPCRP